VLGRRILTYDIRTLQQSTGRQSTRPQVISFELVRVYVRVSVRVSVMARTRVCVMVRVRFRVRVSALEVFLK